MLPLRLLPKPQPRRLALDLPAAQLVLEPLDADKAHRMRRAHPAHRQARALPFPVCDRVDRAPRRALRRALRLLSALPETHRVPGVEAGVREQADRDDVGLDFLLLARAVLREFGELARAVLPYACQCVVDEGAD